MSDTVKIILIVAIFAFFIYKRKISSFLSDRKAKRLGRISEKKTGKGTVSVSSAVSKDTENTADAKDASVTVPEKASPYRYEVYVFDYAQYADTEHFSDRVSAKLDVIEMSMQNKRHYIKFVELGTLLLIVVKYCD